MQMQIKRISLSKVLKLELSGLINAVIDVMESNDMDALRLQANLDMLYQLKPLMRMLESPYGPHPITETLNNQKKRRVELAAVISGQMDVLVKADYANDRKFIKITEPNVRRSLLKLRKFDFDSISEKLDQFFRRIDKEAELKTAFNHLGFQNYLDELYEVNTSCQQLLLDRNESISQRPKVNCKLIQKYGETALRNLFEHIELCQILYPDADYTNLISGLNTILVQYSREINRRATYNKKRAEKAAAIKEAEKNISTSETHVLEVNGKETGVMSVKPKEKETGKKLINPSENKKIDQPISAAVQPLETLSKLLELPNLRKSE